MLQGTGALLTGPTDVVIQWTNDPCPASPLDKFPNPIGAGFMTYEGKMDTPDWLDTGDEFSYSIGTQPQCERISFKFQLDPGASINYRSEVQTLCFTPTAIALAAFKAEPRNSAILAVSLIGGLFLLAAGAAVLYRRRLRVGE